MVYLFVSAVLNSAQRAWVFILAFVFTVGMIIMAFYVLEKCWARKQASL